MGERGAYLADKSCLVEGEVKFEGLGGDDRWRWRGVFGKDRGSCDSLVL